MFELIPGKLSIKNISELLNSDKKIKLISSAYTRMENSYRIVQDVIKEDRSVYGINTGFGALYNVKISSENLSKLQKNLVMSHACGTGELVPKP